MKKMSRLTILILTMALTMALVLGGCAKTEANDPTAEPVKTQETQAQATEAAQETQAPTPVTYEEAEVTLNYYKNGCSGPLTGWLDDYVITNTGCHIEFVDLTKEVMQTQMAGGELPDLITFLNGDWENVDIAINGNMLLCLDDYQDSIPDLINNVPAGLKFIRDAHSAGTGKAYVAPDNVGEYYSTMMEYSSPSPSTQYAANLRWEIYQAIGAPEVATVDDFIPVLKQMQDYYPKTEDGQKVYAFALFPDWDGSVFYHAEQYLSLHGTFMGLQKYFIEWDFTDNTVSPMLEEGSEYLKSLKFFFDANQLGLVDPDSISQSYATAKEKLNAGQLLTAWVWNSGSGFSTKENVNADPPKGFASIITDDYVAAVSAKSIPIGSNHPMGIGAATKYPEESLRFLNFFYTYDANMTFFNGPKGDLWDVDESGNLYATDMYDQYLADKAIELTGGGALDINGVITRGSRAFMATDIHPGYNLPMEMQYWPLVMSKAEISKLNEEWMKSYNYESPLALLVDQDRIGYRPLAHYLVETTPDDIATLSGQIGDVVTTYSWQMVLAADENEFNALKAEMIEQAKGLGLDQVVNFGVQVHANAVEKSKLYE